jgi:hypothetical protein
MQRSEREARREIKVMSSLIGRQVIMLAELLNALPLDKRERLLGAGFRDVGEMDDVAFGELLSRLKFTLAE